MDVFFHDLISEEAKLKCLHAEKIKASAATITDNEKKELIKKLKKEYVADLRKNFWTVRLIKKEV